MAAIQMQEKEFQALRREGKTILVDFWAPWCGYCRRIAPAYNQIAQQYAGKLTPVKINIDENPTLANQEKIEVIPTLVLYRDGAAVASIVAPDSLAAIEAFLQENLKN